MSEDYGHRFFAVYNQSGMHIGLWSDGKIAAEVAAETPGNTVEELIRADRVTALLKAEREKALREAVEAIGGLIEADSRDAALRRLNALIEKDATDE